jgi:hypothetical protein
MLFGILDRRGRRKRMQFVRMGMMCSVNSFG